MTQNKRAKVRVLALAAEAFGGRGGIAQSTRDFLLAMSRLEAVGNIDILPRVQSEPTAILPSGIRQFPARNSRLAYALWAIWLAWKLKPNIVYCGHAFMAPLAYIAARVTGARLICHVHGLEVWQPLLRFKKQAISAADLILCVSHYTARKVVEMTGADPQHCKVIYNTIDDRFTLGDRVSARSKFSIPENSIVISTVSRLDPGQRHKGHDRLIPLLKDLSVDYPNLIYLVAGTGGDRARLEALAYGTGAGEIVRFLDFVSDEDLPDLYRASDLYVMPSHGEGFGIAFVEAMACGTLALGLDLGGAGEALRDGELGRAVSEDDFATALHAELATLMPNRSTLSARTHAIFGRPSFEARVAKATASMTAGRPVTRKTQWL